MVEKSESYDSAIELNRTQSSSDEDIETLCDGDSEDLCDMKCGRFFENKKMAQHKEKNITLEMETAQTNLEEIQLLKKLYEDVLNDRQDRQNEIDNLKGALELNKGTIEQLEQAVQFSDKIAQKFREQLQKQIASTLCLQESLKSSNFELNELRANTTKDAQEIDKNSVLVSQLKAQISVLEEQFMEAFNENVSQRRYLELCRDANLELRRQIVSLQQDIGILEAQLRSCQDRIRVYDVVIRDYYTLKIKISQLWTELDIIKQNECRNATLRTQVERLSSDLDELTKLLEDKNKEMQALEKCREESEKSNTQIVEQWSEALTRQRAKYERLLMDMGAEIQLITVQLRTLQDVLAQSEFESETTNSSLQEALAGVKIQNDSLMQECQRLEQQNVILKNNIQDKNAEISKLYKSLSDTRATLENTERNLVDAEQTINSERKLACEQKVHLDCARDKSEMIKELLKTRTDEVALLQSREAQHINSIGLLRKQQECQLQAYQQDVEQLTRQVQNLTANLNRSELNYTTVMRELCEAQSTLLTFTGRQANAIGDESSGSIESNIQKTEMLTRTIDCDVLQQDASTECSHSLKSECSNCNNLSAESCTLRVQLSTIQKQLLDAHAQLTKLNNEKRCLSEKLKTTTEDNAKHISELQATKNELHSTRECQANRNRALEARMNSMREKWAMRNEQLNAELCTMQSSFKELKEQYKCTSEMLARRDCELTSANTTCAELRARSRDVVRDVQAWHREQKMVQRELAQNVKRLNEQLLKGKQEKECLMTKINTLQKANSQLYHELTKPKVISFEASALEYEPGANKITTQCTWAEVPYEEALRLQAGEDDDSMSNDTLIESRWLDQVQSITEQLQRTSSYWSKILEGAHIEET